MCSDVDTAAQMWAWNKVALLQKVLKETPPERAPWILYMQPDTIIDDIAFTFPFEMYQDKHWVSVGKAESVLNGWASGRPLTFGTSVCRRSCWHVAREYAAAAANSSSCYSAC